MDKIFPRFKTDEEIEDFLEEDLSDYLHPQNFKQVTFEFKPKDKSVNVRMSEQMLEAVKTVAKKEGIPYQRYKSNFFSSALTRKVINISGLDIYR